MKHFIKICYNFFAGASDHPRVHVQRPPSDHQDTHPQNEGGPYQVGEGEDEGIRSVR